MSCDDLKLIELVESYTLLYDKKNRLYKDNRAKENAWRAIATSLNRPYEEVTKRWTTLRKRFIEHRKKLSVVPSGSGASTESWSLYQSLMFLNEYVSMRLTTGNVRRPQHISQGSFTDFVNIDDLEVDFERQDSSQQQSQQTEADSDSEFGDLLCGASNSAGLTFASTTAVSTPRYTPPVSAAAVTTPAVVVQPTRGTKRKRGSDVSPELGPALDNAITAMGSYFTRAGNAPPPTPVNEDPAMIFGRSVGIQLMSIRNLATRIDVQAHICNVIAQAVREQDK